MKNIAAYLLTLLLVISASAQDVYNIIDGQTNSYTSDNCIIYDDGGANSDYGAYVEGTIYVNTSNYYVFYRNLHLEYSMELPQRTKIEIWDGQGYGLLYSNTRAADTIDLINICARSIRVYFKTDSDNPQGYGFKLTLSSCDSCYGRVTGLTSSILGETSAKVKWNPLNGATEYLVQLSGSSASPSTIVSVQGDSLMIPVVAVNGDTIFKINHCGYIDVSVYTPCDTLPTSCAQAPCYTRPYTSWQQCTCPTSYPYISRIDNDGDGNLNDYRVYWYSTPTQWTLIIYGGNYRDTIVTTANEYIFSDLDTCQYYYVMLYSNCHDSPIHDDPNPTICHYQTTSISGDCTVIVPPPTPPPCPIPTPNITSTYANVNSITLTWSNDNASTNWVASIYQDTTLIRTDTAETGTITFNNLSPATTYTITIYGYNDTIVCGMLTLPPIYTYNNCIDYLNFESPLTYGSYGNTASTPYNYGGIVDNGAEEVSSRHTINSNAILTDPLTGNLLKVVQQGYTQSVRLGNWTGGRSEAITYTYLVDTAVNDLLLLRYAVVMKDPFGHTSDKRPRFTLEILDSNGNLIDQRCGMADFVAGVSTEGWQTAANSVLWKDWTTVGFNVEPYHNRKIKIRLTTRDCGDGNPTHFGYAYFTLACGKKHSENISCGRIESIPLEAPEGFSYQWYNTNNTNTVLSTDSIYVVSVEGTQYFYCIVSNLENPDCKFRIDAKAGNRFPIASLNYDYTFENCEFKVNIYNTSYVADDPEGRNMVEPRCETAQWLLSDGSFAWSDTIVYTYAAAGDYNIRLSVGLLDNTCTDILDTVIHLVSPTEDMQITGDSAICLGMSATLTASLYGQYQWSNGENTKTIVVIPDTTTTYSLNVRDTFGCTNRFDYCVRVKPSYHNADVHDTICDNIYYAPQGTPLIESGVYPLSLLTVEGCDSIVNLHLVVNPTYIDTIYDSICRYDAYDFHENQYTEAGEYYAMLQSICGCDSLSVLNLNVKPVYIDTIKADIYKGKTFNLYGFSQSEKGVYSQTFEASNGCDSIIVLDLQVDNVIFPNVITANDDGINDVFEIHNLLDDTVFTQTELIIYNRYGKVVYHKKNISQYSDFWKPDKSTPTGTYFYRFIGYRHDRSENHTGTVNVLR